MALVRYEPWRGLGQLQNNLGQAISIFDRAPEGRKATSWSPAVDVTEYKDRFELAIELPGIEPAAVEITLEDGILEIQGEIAGHREDESVVYRRSERRAGKFQRRFSLPDTVDIDNVKATNSYGVLEITIPKLEKLKARRIEIA